MSELVLVKHPASYVSDITDYTLHADQVVGIIPSQSSTILEYGYSPRGDETEEEAGLGDALTEKVTEFYEQTLARDPEKRPFYNCHLFAFYALGKATELKRYRHFRLSGTEAVSDEALLTPGEAYGTTTRDGVINHSILGTQKPMHNISVIGDYRPLVISRNSDIKAFYGAVQLQHTSPRSAEE